MSLRTYTIPTFSALSFTMGAAACTPDIMGVWELTEVDGDSTTYTYSYGNCTITANIDMTAEFDEQDGDKVIGELDTTQSITYAGCESYGYASGTNNLAAEVGDIEAEKEDDDWKVDVKFDVAEDIELTCTIDEDEMDCRDEDENVDYLFERG